MCVPGQEAALLVRVAVDRVVDEVRCRRRSSSAACCPSPARRSRRSTRPASFEVDEERQDRALVRLHARRRTPGRSSTRSSSPASPLALERALPRRRSSGSAVVGVARRCAASRRASAAPRRRTAAARAARRRVPTVEEREVGEVLVVDRVELVVLDQAHQVRELHRRDAARRRAASSCPADEVVEVGDVGEHVVAEQQVGARARPRARARSRARRTAPRVGMPCSLGDLGDVRRRLDAEHGDRRAPTKYCSR